MKTDLAKMSVDDLYALLRLKMKEAKARMLQDVLDNIDTKIIEHSRP